MSRSVLALLDVRPAYTEMLSQKYDLHRWDQMNDKQAFLNQIGKDITALVTSAGFGLPDGLIDDLPNLEVITSFGVGYDSIDVEACCARGIRVSNTPDVLTDDVADTGIDR